MPDIFDPIAWTVARRLGGGNSGGGVAIKNQDKTITENGTYKADSGYTGLGTVNVNVPVPSGTIDITENGSYDVTNFATALVEVAASGGGGNVFASGTITMAQDVRIDNANYLVKVEHNLGFVPTVLFEASKPKSGVSGPQMIFRKASQYNGYSAFGGSSSDVYQWGDFSDNPLVERARADDKEIYLDFPAMYDANLKVVAGNTIYWLVG